MGSSASLGETPHPGWSRCPARQRLAEPFTLEMMGNRLLIVLLSFVSFGQNDPSIAGFSADAARRQKELESRFDSHINRANLQQWLKQFSAKPHHLGSPGSKEVAEAAAGLFRSWGFETEIETLYPLFPTPKTRLLEMTAPARFTAKLTEPAVDGDATSAQTPGVLPPYHAYSIDGDVTGALVYVNYGLPADYEKLAEMGIDVKGKIVIARYGASWRGIKPKVAAEHGATACIIYSDPRDDGYFQGDPYPAGGWRNRDSAQRGSVMDMPTYPGDPLTPGVGATKDARRPPYRQGATLTKIPVLPISWGDAEPLLRALAGPVAPPEWRGGLPFTYHVGPGPATVHLKLEFNWDLAPLYNVVARLKGSDLADQWIIRGNHHDGWVFGASDPLSGAVALLEEARAVSVLAKSGWRPRRTLIYCLWDGEEPALLGSTEWAEFHAAGLQKHAAVYINSDSTGRGFFFAGASHTLETFINQVSRDVTDPQTKVSVQERLRAVRTLRGDKDPAEIPVGALGSGSDYTPFIQHLGIASINFGFGGETASAGVYHSKYDSYDHFVKFEDPDFQYVFATVQAGGRMMLRMANADYLPFRFDSFSRTVSAYAMEVQKLADDLRMRTATHNERVRSRAYELAADPRRTYVAPKAQDPVPHLNFAPLLNAAGRLKESSGAFSKLSLANLTPAAARELDEIMIQSERKLLTDAGLPRRPWYRHQIYAPGYYTGYGVKTLPGVREAIEERNWTEAEQQMKILAGVLDAFASQVDKAAAVVKGGAR